MSQILKTSLTNLTKVFFQRVLQVLLQTRVFGYEHLHHHPKRLTVLAIHLKIIKSVSVHYCVVKYSTYWFQDYLPLTVVCLLTREKNITKLIIIISYKEVLNKILRLKWPKHLSILATISVSIWHYISGLYIKIFRLESIGTCLNSGQNFKPHKKQQSINDIAKYASVQHNLMWLHQWVCFYYVK